MKDEAKPREWTLWFSTLNEEGYILSRGKYQTDKGDEHVDVIEHRAYDALAKENKRLREALEQARQIMRSDLSGRHFFAESEEVHAICKADIDQLGECQHTHILKFINETEALEAKNEGD